MRLWVEPYVFSGSKERPARVHVDLSRSSSAVQPIRSRPPLRTCPPLQQRRRLPRPTDNAQTPKCPAARRAARGGAARGTYPVSQQALVSVDHDLRRGCAHRGVGTGRHCEGEERGNPRFPRDLISVNVRDSICPRLVPRAIFPSSTKQQRSNRSVQVRIAKPHYSIGWEPYWHRNPTECL